MQHIALSDEQLGEARQFLVQIDRLEAAIEMRSREIQRIMESALRISRALGSAGLTRGIDDRASDCVAEYVDLQTDVLRDLMRLKAHETGIREAIDRIPNALVGEVVRGRCLAKLSFSAIAVNLGVSDRHAFRLYRAGVEHIALQLMLGDARPTEPPRDDRTVVEAVKAGYDKGLWRDEHVRQAGQMGLISEDTVRDIIRMRR